MKPVFYSAPIQLPCTGKAADREIRSGIQKLNRRALELWQAAALIAASEPGLLTASDRDSARRRGLAAGRRILSDSPKGKARVAYFRTLTGAGLHAAPETVASAADRVWLLEDRYGLADSYLRAVADTALQYCAECILCPNPLRRDRLEAVFLPSYRAALISLSAIEDPGAMIGRRVHLDRVPDAERKQALRAVLRENKKWIDSLTNRAAQLLKNAEILRNLNTDTCAEIDPCL